MDDLKRCPFCGGRPHIEKTERTTAVYNLPSKPYITYTVKCLDCGASGGVAISGEGWQPEITPDQALKQAVRKWNGRI